MLQQVDVSTALVSSPPFSGFVDGVVLRECVVFCPFIPKGFLYSPALLLDGGFDVSITDPVDFRVTCVNGFESWFEELWEEDEQGNEVFSDHRYSWDEVEQIIVESVARRYDAIELHLERLYGYPSLSKRAGFMLGWLSALALVDRELAIQGVELLALLVSCCQQEESTDMISGRPVLSDLRSARTVGGDGWPLDM